GGIASWSRRTRSIAARSGNAAPTCVAASAPQRAATSRWPCTFIGCSRRGRALVEPIDELAQPRVADPIEAQRDARQLDDVAVLGLGRAHRHPSDLAARDDVAELGVELGELLVGDLALQPQHEATA